MLNIHILRTVFCLVTVASAKSDSETSELKKEIAHLKQTLTLQSSRIAALEQYDTKHLEKEEVQNTKLVQLQRIVDDSRSKLNNKTLSVESPHSMKTSAMDGHRLPRFLEDGYLNVAFYAYKANSFTDVASHRTMIYDTVITNVGGGYNPNTGIFTPPSAGVYAFAWVIIASGRNDVNNNYGEISIELMQNGNSRGSIHADTEIHGDDDSATGFAVLNLQPTDSVYLRSTLYAYNQGSFVSTQEQGRWSFSGFRVA